MVQGTPGLASLSFSVLGKPGACFVEFLRSPLAGLGLRPGVAGAGRVLAPWLQIRADPGSSGMCSGPVPLRRFWSFHEDVYLQASDRVFR